MKDCPFCGGRPVEKPAKQLRDGCKQGESDAYAYFVVCKSCACQGGWMKSYGGAIRLWQMRTCDPKYEQ